MANACSPIIAPTKILIELGKDSIALMIASIVDDFWESGCAVWKIWIIH